MKVKLLKWQRTVFDDPHRFRVVCAGRRSGKSVLARIMVLDWAIKHQGVYYIVSPSYKQSKAIFWRAFQKEIPREWIKAKNEVELSLTLVNGSVIALKGAENPDSLRGVALRGLVVDEIASLREWDWLWSEVLRATLADHQAPALFISTPKGFNSFYELYKKGQVLNDTYKSWQFTTLDNKYILNDEVEAARKELSEDTFHQEYLADFRHHTGLAFKSWDRTLCLIEPFEVPDEWPRGRGFDYGQVNPTASVRMAVDPDDNCFIENSYLNAHGDVKQHAEAIKAMDYGLPFVPCWGDPSGKQWQEEFSMHGLQIQNADKTIGQGATGWVEFCINQVDSLFKPIPGHTVRLPDGRVLENAPQLFILNNGKNDKLVSQIENLSWKTTPTGEAVPVLDESGDTSYPNGHYDLVAALRYLIVSYQPDDKDFQLPDETEEVRRRYGW